MGAERARVLALAAAIAWRRHDTEALLVLRAMGLQGVPIAWGQLAWLRQQLPLGAGLLSVRYQH